MKGKEILINKFRYIFLDNICYIPKIGGYVL